MAGDDYKQKRRIDHRNYTAPSEQPAPEDIKRMTVCQCERPCPVRESLGTAPWGVEQFDVHCLTCGRRIK
jgi:hypothetical protein